MENRNKVDIKDDQDFKSKSKMNIENHKNSTIGLIKDLSEIRYHEKVHKRVNTLCKTKKTICIWGGKGAGKSTFLEQLYNDFKSTYIGSNIYYIKFSGINSTFTALNKVYFEITGQLDKAPDAKFSQSLASRHEEKDSGAFNMIDIGLPGEFVSPEGKTNENMPFDKGWACQPPTKSSKNIILIDDIDQLFRATDMLKKDDLHTICKYLEELAQLVEFIVVTTERNLTVPSENIYLKSESSEHFDLVSAYFRYWDVESLTWADVYEQQRIRNSYEQYFKSKYVKDQGFTSSEISKMTKEWCRVTEMAFGMHPTYFPRGMMMLDVLLKMNEANNEYREEQLKNIAKGDPKKEVLYELEEMFFNENMGPVGRVLREIDKFETSEWQSEASNKLFSEIFSEYQTLSPRAYKNRQQYSYLVQNFIFCLSANRQRYEIPGQIIRNIIHEKYNLIEEAQPTTHQIVTDNAIWEFIHEPDGDKGKLKRISPSGNEKYIVVSGNSFKIVKLLYENAGEAINYTQIADALGRSEVDSTIRTAWFRLNKKLKEEGLDRFFTTDYGKGVTFWKD